MKKYYLISLLLVFILASGQQSWAKEKHDYKEPAKVLTVSDMILRPGGVFNTYKISRDDVFDYLKDNPYYETWYNDEASKLYDNGITIVSQPKKSISCCEFLPLPFTTLIEYKFKGGFIGCTEYDFLYLEKKEAKEARSALIKQLRSLEYKLTDKDSDSETYEGSDAEFLIGNIEEDGGLYMLILYVYPK